VKLQAESLLDFNHQLRCAKLAVWLGYELQAHTSGNKSDSEIKRNPSIP
jgi:hypothetical protein